MFYFFSRLKIEPGEAGPNRYQESPYPMVFRERTAKVGEFGFFKTKNPAKYGNAVMRECGNGGSLQCAVYQVRGSVVKNGGF